VRFTGPLDGEGGFWIGLGRPIRLGRPDRRECYGFGPFAGTRQSGKEHPGTPGIVQSRQRVSCSMMMAYGFLLVSSMSWRPTAMSQQPYASSRNIVLTAKGAMNAHDRSPGRRLCRCTAQVGRMVRAGSQRAWWNGRARPALLPAVSTVHPAWARRP